MEFGARGDPWPTENRQIESYAAQEFPDFFEEPACTVDVLALRRTFWEKATTLRAEYHRDLESPTPQYFSRHYYDLATLADTDEGKEAMQDRDLLKRVADQGGLLPLRVGERVWLAVGRTDMRRGMNDLALQVQECHVGFKKVYRTPVWDSKRVYRISQPLHSSSLRLWR